MLSDFTKWTEVTKHLYRYVISPGACYEILVTYKDVETDILDAIAELYTCGDWHAKDRPDFYERKLLFIGRVSDCVKAIETDNEETNK